MPFPVTRFCWLAHTFWVLCRVLLLVGLFTDSLAQKVGVVLSGGGAKGLAHIGVLKALNEQNIPVDYIVGTSMGGIVGGFYAAGYTPDQMATIATSPEFQDWVSGRTAAEYQYCYAKKDENASWLSVKLVLDTSFHAMFRPDLVSDVPLNFALAELLAQPSARAGYNFDSLLVPFRCLAADIFTQQTIVLRDGTLNTALRATSTVPFFFPPIRVNGKYLFDGGMYNNFPADVARQEFHPDILIGVNVSSKTYNRYPYQKDNQLLADSFIYMMLSKSDSTQVGENGIYIQPNTSKYSVLDFTYAEEMIQAGYEAAMAKMDVIKAQIARRQDADSLQARRNALLDEPEKITVGDVRISGLQKSQESYVASFFRMADKPMPLADVKRAYYKLATDENFQLIYPEILYDTARHNYQLNLQARRDHNLITEVGGNIASRNIHQLFVGLQYNFLKRSLYSFYANFYTGLFYQSAQLKTRINFPTRLPMYVEPEFVYNNWDYLRTSDLLFPKTPPTILQQYDRRFGVNAGFALHRQGKFVASAAYFNNSDYYSNLDLFRSSDTLDFTNFAGQVYGVTYHSNTLNRKQYASRGSAYKVALRYIRGRETYTPGNTAELDGKRRAEHEWIRLKASAEKYFDFGRYQLGYLFESVLSDQSFFRTLTSNLITLPVFQPLQDSRTLFLSNFRSPGYVAAGIRNVFQIRRNFEARTEAYCFAPFQRVVADEQNQPHLADLTSFGQTSFAGTAGLVFHSPLGPVSASLNYYEGEEKSLGFLFHLGYLLYHGRSLE